MKVCPIHNGTLKIKTLANIWNSTIFKCGFSTKVTRAFLLQENKGIFRI